MATKKAFGTDRRRLDGQLGMTAVLHTWGQTLTRHVHLHCLVPRGAFGADDRWHPARSTYLFPVRALSRHFRGRMVSELRQAYQRGELSRITRPGEVDSVLDRLMGHDWAVYSKPCLTQPETIVAYLARYSHRTALSDARIGEIEEGKVALSYKDYRDDDRWKVMELDGEELIRRFLLHVLPKGLMRIRHYGFLANRCRKAKLARIREWLAKPQEVETSDGSKQAKDADWPCPKCRIGHLQVQSVFGPIRFSSGRFRLTG